MVPIGQLSATPTSVPTTIPTPTPTALPSVLRGKIAFLSDRLGEPAVFVMNPDGTNVALLTDEWPYERALALDMLSPDRSQRLFVTLRGGSYEIWVENQADGFTFPLVTGDRTVYDPVWSPAGPLIAFVSTEAGNDEIFVLNRDSQQETRLTANVWEWDKHPTWSPDGTSLAFWSNRETSRRQIWVMRADGTSPRNLSNNTYNDWNPVWIK